MIFHVHINFFFFSFFFLSNWWTRVISTCQTICVAQNPMLVPMKREQRKNPSFVAKLKVFQCPGSFTPFGSAGRQPQFVHKFILLYRRIKYWFVDEKYLIQLVYVFIDMILNFIFHESFEFMCSRFYNLT